MVGTVFIHAVANAYATYAHRAHLDIELPLDVEAEVGGALPVIKTSWGIKIDVGDIQFGQSREFVVIIPKSYANISAMLTYRPFNGSEDIKAQAIDSTIPNLSSLTYHTARLDFVDILFSISKIDNLTNTITSLTSLKTHLSTTPTLTTHTDAQALAKDISGESLLALQAPNNFHRWGKHYLPSLARAHQRQQSANFKDPGLQVYGRDSILFKAERDKLDAAFDALPPPKPSLPVYHYAGGGSPGMNIVKKKGGFGKSIFGGSTSARPKAGSYLSSMAVYNTASGPCFAGDCLVKVPGGKEVRVEELKRGMEIESMVGPRKVGAVVRTGVPLGEALLCRIGGGESDAVASGLCSCEGWMGVSCGCCGTGDDVL